MEVMGLDLSFLDNVKIGENENPIKGIRFKEDELYMLKYIAYKGVSFSSYVKLLINEDIKKHCNGLDHVTKDMIRQMIKEELQNINSTVEPDEDLDALEELGIKKR